MQVSTLPKRPDVVLTALGLGGAQAGNFAGARTDEQVASTVVAAWDAGIRYVDTAPHYGLGLSERRLGALLREHPRDEYVLSTKVGRLIEPSPEAAHRSDADENGFHVPSDHRRVWDLSRDGIRRSIADSLTRLGLDRIDIAFLHDPEDRMDEAVSEAMPALAELRDEGVVRAVGAGMNFSDHLARFVRECDIDVVLCAGRYTLLDHTALADLLPAATDQGVGVVIGGVYNSGLLAVDRPGTDATFDNERAPRELIERANALADVCERHGVTLPEAALAFVTGHPAVVSTVVGCRDAADVRQAAERAAAVVPAELWDDLRSAGLIPEDAPTP
jgi:D-threo-aldose 1-dehydrogenase